MARERTARAASVVLLYVLLVLPASSAPAAAALPSIELRAGEIACERIELRWTPPAGGPYLIELSRGTNAAPPKLIAVLPAEAGRYLDARALTGGTRYRYSSRCIRGTSTGVIKGGQPARRLSLPLGGASRLVLVTGDGGDGIGSDHSVWATPQLVRDDGRRVPLPALHHVEFTVGYGDPGPVDRTYVICGRDYPRSIFAHAKSRLVFRLDGTYARFETRVGVGNKNRGTVTFAVMAEGGPAPRREITVRTKERQKSTGNTTWHVDPQSGDDSNEGTTPARAWQTLARVNEVVFAPGDRILLRAGSHCAGQLAPRGSGARGRGLVFGKYGDGPRPRIDGEGKVRATVHLRNMEYVEVRDLEITNTGPEREAGRRGVYVEVTDFGTAHDVALRNLHIHDVNGSNVKKGGAGSGIHWSNGGATKKTRFDGFTIEGCHLVRCDRNAITGGGYWGRDAWHPNLNVVMRNNLLEDIGGDCIVWTGCDGALIERNTIRGGRMRAKDAAAGIWPWCSDNSIVQFNDVSGVKGTLDGQSFDVDDNSRGTIIQYNYSHDNDGGFLLVCCIGDGGDMAVDSIVRYNISENDGAGEAPPRERKPRIIHIAGPARNTRIYNNVFYVGKHITTDFIANWNYEGWARDVYLSNNIIYADGKLTYALGKKTRFEFRNNVFYGTHVNPPADPGAIPGDPMLAAPGTGKGIDSLEGYRLKPDSPCRGAAKPVPDNGGRDFWGSPVGPGGPNNVGVDERR